MSRAPAHSHDTHNIPFSSRNLNISSGRRTGSLFSWREGDLSKSDEPSRSILVMNRNPLSNCRLGGNYPRFDNDMPLMIVRIVSSWEISFQKLNEILSSAC